MKSYDAAHWISFAPKDGGESFYFEVSGPAVELEVRAVSGATVSLVTQDGELLFFDEGKIVEVKGHFSGFKAVEVTASKPFMVRSHVRPGWIESPDPTPMSMATTVPADPVREAVANAIREQLTKIALQGAFKEDVDVEELYDDFVNGDVEFEEEPDLFGLGAATVAEDLAEKAKVAGDDEEEEEEVEHPPAKQSDPAKPGPAPAEKTPEA